MMRGTYEIKVAMASSMRGNHEMPRTKPTNSDKPGSTEPPNNRMEKGTMSFGFAIPSVAFLSKPLHTWVVEVYMRQRAISLASNISVRNPAFRKALGN